MDTVDVHDLDSESQPCVRGVWFRTVRQSRVRERGVVSTVRSHVYEGCGLDSEKPRVCVRGVVSTVSVMCSSDEQLCEGGRSDNRSLVNPSDVGFHYGLLAIVLCSNLPPSVGYLWRRCRQQFSQSGTNV